MVDVLISGVSFWAVGWGFSYGRSTNSFLGVTEFFGIGMDPNLYPLWFFQYVFAATAATIVSGAVAERVEFFGYIVFSIFITGIKLDIINLVNIRLFTDDFYKKLYLIRFICFSICVSDCGSLGME